MAMRYFNCEINEGKRFEKGPCPYEKNLVKKQNSTCPECIYYRTYLAPANIKILKPHEKPLRRKHKRSIISKEQNRSGPGNEKKQDLFSGWNVYPAHCFWSRDSRTNKLTPDFVFGLEDSQILGCLFYQFEREAKEGEAKGMEKFWWKVQNLLERKQRNYECLTEEEKKILREAKDGSVEAIQKLVIANPRLIHLPFVADYMESLIRAVKFQDGGKSKEAKRSWQGFLPKRIHNKHVIGDEYLVKALRSIMDLKKCTKEKAVEILHHNDPSFKKERLRKISVGIKQKH
jgi:hypothetical protein